MRPIAKKNKRRTSYFSMPAALRTFSGIRHLVLLLTCLLMKAKASGFVGSPIKQRTVNHSFNLWSTGLSLNNSSSFFGMGVTFISIVESGMLMCNLLSQFLCQIYARLLPYHIVILPYFALILTLPLAPRALFRKAVNSTFFSGIMGDRRERVYVSPCFS